LEEKVKSLTKELSDERRERQLYQNEVIKLKKIMLGRGVGGSDEVLANFLLDPKNDKREKERMILDYLRRVDGAEALVATQKKTIKELEGEAAPTKNARRHKTRSHNMRTI
jgi:hypothetical protein